MKSDNIKTCNDCKLSLSNGYSKNHQKEFPKHHQKVKIKIFGIIKILNAFNAKKYEIKG